MSLREGGVDLVVAGDVALEGAGGAGLAEVCDELFGFALEALGLVAEDEGGAGFGELLGDGVGDAALVGDAEDDGDFALDVDHDVGCLLFDDANLRISAESGFREAGFVGGGGAGFNAVDFARCPSSVVRLKRMGQPELGRTWTSSIVVALVQEGFGCRSFRGEGFCRRAVGQRWRRFCLGR